MNKLNEMEEELKAKFHGLSAPTIGEYKKTFNLFMKDLEVIEPQLTRKFVSGLQCKNKQEEIFKLKLLLKFCTFEDLFAVLISGDRILIRILLKNVDTLLLLQNFSGEEFIQNVCPNISYVTRKNLINKISILLKDENLAYDYHNEICRCYGKQIAAPLLIACNNEYFCKHVRSYLIRLSDKQLIRLHEKDPNLIPIYFKENKKFHNVSLVNHNVFARYLCLNDLQTFWRLLEYGIPSIGKRCQIKLLKLYEGEVITNSKYTGLFHPKLISKYLNREEYFQFVKNKLGNNILISYVLRDLEKYLKYIPKKERFDFAYRICKEKHGEDINVTKLNNISSVFSLEHQRIIQEDLESFNIENIKAKINLTSEINDRNHLITKLLETCRLYEDRASLLEVIKYFYNRHKNDNSVVCRTFLYELTQKFPLEELGDEYYKVILDLIKTLDIKGGEHYNRTNVLSCQIIYKFNKNLDYSKELNEFMKYAGFSGWTHLKIKKLQKEHITLYLNNLENFINKKNKIEWVAEDILSHLGNWNVANPNEKISYYKYWNLIQIFFNTIKEIAPCKYFHFHRILKTILLFEPELEEEKLLRKNLIENFIDDYPAALPTGMEMWFLKRYPNIILKHLNLILERIPKLNFFYEINKMQYHPLYHECKKLASENKLSEEIKINLQFMSFEPNFFNIIENYSPVHVEYGIDEDDIDDTVKVHIQVVRLLKSQFVPENGIKYLLPFCEKGYLRYTLESLYSILYYSRESALAAPITALSNRSVSVRKHAIFLISTLGTLEQTNLMLEHMVINEKNLSVRKYLLKRMFKLVKDERTENYWLLLKSLIQSTPEEDQESIFLLRDFEIIAEEFLPDYITTYWDLLKKFKNESEIITLLKTSIINILPLNFCKEIIINYRDAPNWRDFAYEYLISNHATVEERTKLIFSIIQGGNFEDLHFNLQHFCFTLVHNEIPIAISIIEKFINCIDQTPFIFNKLYLELLLNSSLTYLQTPKKNYINLAKFILKTQSKLLEQYGMQILDLYKDFTNWFYNRITGYGKDDIELLMLPLITNLLLVDGSDATKLLVIDLISKNMKVSVKNKFEKLISKLENNASPLVQVYLMSLKIKMS